MDCINKRAFVIQTYNSVFCIIFHMMQIPCLTGCKRRIRKTFEVKIWEEPLLVKKQTIPQQKALDLSFNLAPWKWAWHYHEAVTPSRRRTTFFTLRGPMLFAARGRDALLMMPRPLSGCQIKAEIQGFLLMYSLFLC